MTAQKIKPAGRLIKHESGLFALFVGDHILMAPPDRRPLILGRLRVEGGKWPKRDHRLTGKVPAAWLVDLGVEPQDKAGQVRAHVDAELEAVAAECDREYKLCRASASDAARIIRARKGAA